MAVGANSRREALPRVEPHRKARRNKITSGTADSAAAATNNHASSRPNTTGKRYPKYAVNERLYRPTRTTGPSLRNRGSSLASSRQKMNAMKKSALIPEALLKK